MPSSNLVNYLIPDHYIQRQYDSVGQILLRHVSFCPQSRRVVSTTRTSWEPVCEPPDQARTHGRDRVWDMAFRAQGRILGVDNRWIGQASRAAWRHEFLRG